MSWEPIPVDELVSEIERAVSLMSPEQAALWSEIQIAPEKWALSPWGDLGGGFWAIGVNDDIVVWFNDIEEGFNWSRYSKRGVIGDYWCNQDELQWTIGQVLDFINTGQEGIRHGLPSPTT